MLSFEHTKETIKNIADTTFKSNLSILLPLSWGSKFLS